MRHGGLRVVSFNVYRLTFNFGIMNIFHFERLEVYQLARQLVIDVYRLLKRFPEEEKYALCSQIRRAATSITSNIAEGMGRLSPKEQLYHISVAYGSLSEVWSQLDISVGLGYLDRRDLEPLADQFSRVSQMLSKLKKNIEDRIFSKSNN